MTSIGLCTLQSAENAVNIAHLKRWRLTTQSPGLKYDRDGRLGIHRYGHHQQIHSLGTMKTARSRTAPKTSAARWNRLLKSLDPNAQKEKPMPKSGWDPVSRL
jgi:hypothetical protein